MQSCKKNLISRNLLLILLVLLIAFIQGCGFASEKREAQDLMSSYFECVRADDLEGIKTFYTADGSSNRLPLMVSSRNFGDLLSYRVQGWYVTQRTFISKGQKTSSTSVELRYRVRYSTATTKEWYLLEKHNSDEAFLIAHVRIEKKFFISALNNFFNRLADRK